MGGSGRWLKSLIGTKKCEKEDQEKHESRGSRKWKIWKNRSSSSSSRAHSEASDYSPTVAEDVYNAVISTIARAQPKDFRVVREEWAAIRIQTAFRRFLARRAFRALKAVVRLQAIFRGRRVRKQAAITLRCMQALVRVQARVRAHQVRMSTEGKAVQMMLEERQTQSNPLKQAEENWCDRHGTLEEVAAKLRMRKQGAIKRERALSYSQQLRRSNSNTDTPKMNYGSNLALHKMKYEPERGGWGWSWLERWMAAKPWENRLLEQSVVDFDGTPRSLICTDDTRAALKFNNENIEDHLKPKYKPERIKKQNVVGSVAVRRNTISTRISARPAVILNPHRSSARSSSSPSEIRCDESSASSPATASTPISSSAHPAFEENSITRPSYMNSTAAMKAKQKSSSSERERKHASNDFQQHKKSFGVDSTNISWSQNLTKQREMRSIPTDVKGYLHVD